MKKASKLDQIRTEREENSPCAQQQEDKHIRASRRVSAGSFIEHQLLAFRQSFKEKAPSDTGKQAENGRRAKEHKLTHGKLLLWMGESKFEMLFDHTVIQSHLKVCNTAIAVSWEFADK